MKKDDLAKPEESMKAYTSCTLCPRSCKVNRSAGETGVCHMGDTMKVARAALHFWEEPCISGSAGSGAVFFSGCNLRCVFCQNREISSLCYGEDVSVEALAEIFLRLEREGAENINLVTGTHFVPSIAMAIRRAREKGIRIPFVYNSSGYESVAVLQLLEGLIDIYLPDAKYAEGELAQKYSTCRDYPEVCFRAIDEMVRQVGECAFDDRGMMKRGVIVRHLLLPGHKKNAYAVLERLYAAYGNRIYYSLLAQYTPLPWAIEHFPELGRRVTRREYEVLCDYAIQLGIENAFVQEMETAKESFIPVFDGTGIDRL